MRLGQYPIFSAIIFIFFATLTDSISFRVCGQFTLTNGFGVQGLVAPSGHVDSWSFTASPGNSVFARVGVISSTNGFVPRLQLFSPSNALLISTSAPVAEVSINATIPGTYTLTIDDGSAGGTGTGSYRLKWIKPGSPIVTATGDEGGALINGGMHIGVIPVGDFDAWTFSAASGDNIVVRIGETTPGSSLSPLLKLYGPDGSLLAFASSAEAAEVAVRATNNGLFTVVAGDGSAGFTGSGNYRLSLGKTGSTIVISPADEGGSMSGIASYSGTIDVGDLDIWTFSACAGDSLQIQMSELTPGAALSPWLRLYGRDGLLLDSVSNAAIAQISRLAPAAGTYTVIAGDGSPGLGGSGAYTLSVNALSSGLKFCSPNLFGTNLNLRGVGGVSNATFVLLQSTNAGSAIGLWSPMLTNQFDGFGAFSLTNFINPATHQQFFRLAEPQ